MSNATRLRHALGQLCAAALAWSRDVAEAHAWAARALAEAAGPEAETAVRHLRHGRHDEARVAMRRLLGEAPADA